MCSACGCGSHDRVLRFNSGRGLKYLAHLPPPVGPHWSTSAPQLAARCAALHRARGDPLVLRRIAIPARASGPPQMPAGSTSQLALGGPRGRRRRGRGQDATAGSRRRALGIRDVPAAAAGWQRPVERNVVVGQPHAHPDAAYTSLSGSVTRWEPSSSDNSTSSPTWWASEPFRMRTASPWRARRDFELLTPRFGDSALQLRTRRGRHSPTARSSCPPTTRSVLTR